MAVLVASGMSVLAASGTGIATGRPATAAATCPTVEPEGPENWPTPVPAPSAGVDWSGCDLSGAYIISADLSDADLRGTDLDNAQLWGSDLTDADLRGATLRGDDLGGRCDDGIFAIGGADLDGADLTDADLTSADLGGEYSYVGTQRCVESGADLDDITISGADLTDAGLLGVTSADISGEPASLPTHWILETGTLYGPGATCTRVTGKATLSFRDCLWTVMDPFTSTPSASLPAADLTAGGTLDWRIAHPQTGRPRQTSALTSVTSSSPGEGICPSGSTEQDVSGILSAGFDAGDSVTVQLCRRTRTGAFELGPGTTAGL